MEQRIYPDAELLEVKLRLWVTLLLYLSLHLKFLILIFQAFPTEQLIIRCRVKTKQVDRRPLFASGQHINGILGCGYALGYSIMEKQVMADILFRTIR